METPEQFKKAVQINNKGTRTTSQSNNKDNRRHHRRRYDVFIVRFEQFQTFSSVYIVDFERKNASLALL